MRITCDPAKRAKILAERDLDLMAAAEVFDGPHLTIEDDRFDYGERRFVTVGHNAGRMVVLVWTPRGETCRVSSIMKANDREQAAYAPRF